MRTLGIIALCVVLLIGVAVVWYMLAYPTYSYRYRMTVEVMADGVLHSASSVIEVRLQKQPQFLVPVPPVYPAVSGEAVFVDLGDGRNAIALLASGPNASNVDYPIYVVPTHFRLSFEDRDLVKYAGLQGQWDLPEQALPTLVTFADLNDPKTARVVGSAEFEQVFGPGVRFKRAFVEMVPAGTWPFNMLGWPRDWAGEPVTRGIEKRVTWIGNYEAETTFERRLRETGGGGGGVLMPGRNLRRGV